MSMYPKNITILKECTRLVRVGRPASELSLSDYRLRETRVDIHPAFEIARRIAVLTSSANANLQVVESIVKPY